MLHRPRVAAMPLLLLVPFSGPLAAQESGAPLVQQARAAASADRNRESADLFERALAAEPARRAELLREFADQLTYSGQARRAVPLYRERLREPLPPGERLLALKGLGLALLWSDQPGPAAEVYSEILSVAPDDGDARRNHARALAWSGRPRAAAAALESWLAQQPQDADAARLSAEFLGWTGQTGRALALLPAGTGETATDALRRRLLIATAPTTTLEAARSRQSDDLEIAQVAVEHQHPLDSGRAMAGLRLERLRFEPEDRSGAVTVDRPMLLGRLRFNPDWEMNARVGSDRTRVAGGRRYNGPVYSTWVTWWPSDRWRLDASAGRSPFDSLRALELGLSARTYAISADVTPNERWRGGVRYERAAVSDGNRRDRVDARAETRLSLALGAWAGMRWTGIRFDELLDNGYFNPRRLSAPQLTLRVSPRARDDRPWDFAVDAAWGREFADPGGSKPSWELGVTSGLRLDDDWRLQLGWRRFSTRTSGLSGFERTTAALSLQRRW